jgi:hypothetical protein
MTKHVSLVASGDYSKDLATGSGQGIGCRPGYQDHLVKDLPLQRSKGGNDSIVVRFRCWREI